MIRTIVCIICSICLLPSLAICAIDASRTSGVAPLYVTFSAGMSASSGSTISTFHTYDFSWSFGDTNAGTWAHSGKSRNTEKGGTVSHVFDQPGTYTVTLTVKNTSGSTVETDTETITVSNPDTVFSGTNTTCISSTNTFTGCPSGATQVNTSSLSTLGSYADAGERILFRRGDSWTVTGSISWPTNSGPVQIGAFGTCSSPDPHGICSNAPVINLDYSSGLGSPPYFIPLDNRNDWRLMDISFAGDLADWEAGGGFRITAGATGIKNHLAYRIKSRGGDAPMGWSHWRLNDADYLDNNGIVLCDIQDFYSYGFFGSGERLSLLGNTIEDSDTTHLVRVQQSYLGSIRHNKLSGTSLSTGTGRLAIKLHGVSTLGTCSRDNEWMGNYADAGGGGFRVHTTFNVIADNIIGRAGPLGVSIASQDDLHLEVIRDTVIENNKFIEDSGTATQDAHQEFLYLVGEYTTIRNNVFNFTDNDMSDLQGSVYISRVGPCDTQYYTNRYTWIYNNTHYASGGPYNNWAGFSYIHQSAEDIVIRNNIVSFPNITGTGAVVYDNTSGEVVTSNNLLSKTPGLVDPGNASWASRNFQLSSGSPAIDAGYAGTVITDLTGAPRTGTMEIGAYKYGPSFYGQIGSGAGTLNASGGGSFQQ